MGRYYDRRRAELAEARSNRYWSDPAYREEVKRRAKESYARRKSGKLLKPKERSVAAVVAGREVRVYGMGALAEACGCPKSTLVSLERRGILPLPQIANSRGWRMYSLADIDAISEAFRAAYGRRRRPERDQHFASLVRDRWQRES